MNKNNTKIGNNFKNNLKNKIAVLMTVLTAFTALTSTAFSAFVVSADTTTALQTTLGEAIPPETAPETPSETTEIPPENTAPPETQPNPIITEEGDIIIKEDPEEQYNLITTADGKYKYFKNSDGKATLFSYLGNETEVVLPETLDDLELNNLRKMCFESNTALKTLTLPKTLDSLEPYALYLNTALENIYVAEGNTVFTSVDGVLYDIEKTSIVQYPIARKDYSYTIPETVTYIATGCFGGCKYLEKIDIPDSVTDIDGWAFRDCKSLKTCDIPAGVKYIGEYAFAGCYEMKSFDLPVGINTIYPGTFGNCIRLTTIKIPENVSEIGYSAFFGCSSLESVEFNDGLENIKDYAFGNCPNFMSIRLMGDPVLDYRPFGAKLNASGESVILRDFKITGQPGGNVEKYATDNSLSFTPEGPAITTKAQTVALTIPVAPKSDGSTTTAVKDKNKDDLKMGIVVGIVCGGLVLVIIIIVVMSVKSKGLENSDKAEETAENAENNDIDDESGYNPEEDNDNE
jgi:hypothetical protein